MTHLGTCKCIIILSMHDAIFENKLSIRRYRHMKVSGHITTLGGPDNLILVGLCGNSHTNCLGKQGWASRAISPAASFATSPAAFLDIAYISPSQHPQFLPHILQQDQFNCHNSRLVTLVLCAWRPLRWLRLEHLPVQTSTAMTSRTTFLVTWHLS